MSNNFKKKYNFLQILIEMHNLFFHKFNKYRKIF